MGRLIKSDGDASIDDPVHDKQDHQQHQDSRSPKTRFCPKELL